MLGPWGNEQLNTIQQLNNNKEQRYTVPKDPANPSDQMIWDTKKDGKLKSTKLPYLGLNRLDSISSIHTILYLYI